MATPSGEPRSGVSLRIRVSSDPMPGSPVRRARKLAQMEADRLNGLDSDTFTYHVDPVNNEIIQEPNEEGIEMNIEDLKKIEGAPRKGQRGASKEYMDALRARRKEMAKTDPTKNGGRHKKPRLTRAQATEAALDRLEPMALRVLESQLKSVDERVRQTAAIKILEWKRGKPSQQIKVDGEQVHTVRYETVAFAGTALPPKHDLELPVASIIEDDDDDDSN